MCVKNNFPVRAVKGYPRKIRIIQFVFSVKPHRPFPPARWESSIMELQMKWWIICCKMTSDPIMSTKSLHYTRLLLLESVARGQYGKMMLKAFGFTCWYTESKTESEAKRVENRCPGNSPPHPRKCPCWASACGRCGQQSRHCQVKCNPSVMWLSPASQQPGPWPSGPLHSPGNKGHHLHIQLTTQVGTAVLLHNSQAWRPLPRTT